MELNTIYPWQQTIWQTILQSRLQDRFPHALLFSGIMGIGKNQFAQALAHAVLCSQPDSQGQACGNCRSCHLCKAQSHPDFKIIAPEEDGQIIKIDQIRSVVTFVNETALLSGYRVIIINPATAMNTNAANSLLKTLEEPTPKTLIILISHQSLRLSATISSRCQRIVFAKPRKDLALSWLRTQNFEKEQCEILLNLAEGAPLKAKELAENNVLALRKELYDGMHQISRQQIDPLQLAASFEEKCAETTLSLLLIWLKDLLRLKITNNQADLINQDNQVELIAMSAIISNENLLRYIDQVQQSYASVTSLLNRNRLLLLEEIFIRWAQLCF